MSLVSVKEEKETNGGTEQLGCSVSVMYVAMCVLVKDVLAADLQVLAHRGAIVLTEAADPACGGQSGPSVSRQIKKILDQHSSLQFPAAEQCRLTDTNVAMDVSK